jgi:acyl-CoA reductase-like NAD-dependent aldehyde dehydrogenase
MSATCRIAPSAQSNPLRRPGSDAQVFDVGAMTFPPQMERARQQIDDAVAQGARLLAGGARASDKPGNYFAPTLLAETTTSMRVMSEETFSPVLPIMRVRSAEEALRLTNDSPLGLSGSIWSRDIGRARALARRIESGSVCINDVLFNYLYVEAPLGGVKQSGLGIRHGAEALRQFTRIQTIVEDRPLLGFVSAIVMRMFGFRTSARCWSWCGA